MTASRREFLKTTGFAVGVASLPAWSEMVSAGQPALSPADKNDFADLAISTAKKLGATYADIRINRYRTETINTRERQVLNVSRGQNFGFGVRVLVKGTWGFAASADVTASEVRRVTREAIDITRANSSFQRKPI